MYKEHFPHKRYRHTLNFLKTHVPESSSILDLGVENPFTKIMKDHGFKVENTKGEDLDLDTSAVKTTDAQVVTAFEIFEHLLAPFNVLRDVKADRVVASVPLKLWFAPAYRSKTDPWDRHYHEFESWQFDWLFEKAGWTIKKREQFTNPVNK